MRQRGRQRREAGGEGQQGAAPEAFPGGPTDTSLLISRWRYQCLSMTKDRQTRDYHIYLMSFIITYSVIRLFLKTNSFWRYLEHSDLHRADHYLGKVQLLMTMSLIDVTFYVYIYVLV